MLSNQEFRHSQVTVGESSLHVVEAGDSDAPPILFLHGWPESWFGWRAVMALAAPRHRVIAIDLPGVGGSSGDPTDGSKAALATIVRGVVEALELSHLTLVGQDVGGMVAYAYARSYDDLDSAVIMDVVIPGVDPWDAVLRNPYLWHFVFHTIPGLPELLVTGQERAYFDYFYDILSPDPSLITEEARASYVEAYQADGALSAGFSWYRTLSADARANAAQLGRELATPVLYLRGEKEGGRMEDYLTGFAAAGLTGMTPGLITGAGHFTQEEAPEQTWQLISDFVRR